MTTKSSRYRYYRGLLAVACSVPLMTMANEGTYEPQAACFLQTTSMIDTYAYPPTGGDTDFFTQDSNTIPNIVIIVDTSGSMKWMPDMPSAAGCNWQTANGSFEQTLRESGYDPRANYWYNPPNRAPYPGGVDCSPMDEHQNNINMNGLNSGRDIQYCNLFGCDPDHPGRYSHGMESTSGTVPLDSCQWGFTNNNHWNVHSTYYRANRSNGPVAGGSAGRLSRDGICNSDSFDDDQQASCHACLDPASPTFAGYWAAGANSQYTYFSGNFLNFFPPRWVGARRVIKDVTAELGKVRLGLVTFSSNTTTGAAWLTDRDGSDRMRPHCVQEDHTVQNARARREMRQSVNENLDFDAFSHWTPLSAALYRVGQYYVSNDGNHLYNKWFSSPSMIGNAASGSGFYETNNNPQSSVCDWCQFSAAIIVTDGMPNQTVLPAEVRALRQGHVTTHDEFVGDPFNCTILNCDQTNDETHLARIAWWLWNHDLRPEWDTPQRLATYAVAFSFPGAMNALREATAQGGGFALEANDIGALREAILDIFEDIISRNSSFTSATVNNVQAQATQSVLMPRLVPQSVTPWPGQLYRFDLLSEFALGIEIDGSDGSGMFLVDQGCYDNPDDANEQPDPSKPTCGPVISSPTTGEFLRRTGDNRWNLADPDADTATAQPFWEAGARLKQLGSQDRKIWTVLYDDPDEPEVIEFKESNAERLAPYLGLTTDRGNQECDLLLNMLGADEILQLALELGLIDLDNPLLPSPLPSPLPPELRDLLLGSILSADCPTEIAAVALIRFIRGRMPNGSSDLEWMLHNIFHSAPTIIEPPTRPDLVMTPFRNPQTMVTLALPHNDPFGDGAEVYQEFWDAHKERDRVALVGSNGGLLHAFHVGACQYDETSRITSCDRGTGNELWAFVPPTLLPKLKHLLLNRRKQHFYVDGYPWVRNVWADGLGDPSERNFERNVDEYRTVAVVGMRRGGSHFFGLDVTDAHDPSEMWQEGPADRNFLWIFPDIGDVNTLTQGQSWNDTGTMPPPIGPIRVKDEKSGAAEANGYPGTNFGERWIVALPGGYDQLHARGMGFHIVDVYTGKPIWQFTRHYEGVRWTPQLGDVSLPSSFDAKDPGTLRRFLRYSFGAPPTLTSWGLGARQDSSNPYFDTLIIPDTGGQVWVARFHDPDPENWAAARIFEEYRDDDPDVFDINRRPFFQPAYLTTMPETGLLRAYLGTGNRHHLRQRGHGQCGPDNLHACVRAGCDDVRGRCWRAKIGDSGEAHVHWNIDDQDDLDIGSFKVDSMDLPWCKSSDGRSRLNIDDCLIGQGNQREDVYSAELEYKCEISSGTFQCWLHKEEVDDENLGKVQCVSDYASQRFYSMRVFGEGAHMPFDGEGSSAQAYDAARLTNDDGSNDGEIVQVSGMESAVGHESAGWYYNYPLGREHSASPAVTAGRCVVWSSLEPPPASCEPGYDGSSNDPCGETVGAQNAYMYFRNYITGAMDCIDLDSLDDSEHGRLHLGSDPQPPPPPQAITQVSEAGETRTTIFTGSDSTDVSEGDELYQDFSMISVPADVHDCRHMANCD